MTWNYRIIFHLGDDPYFAMHEVYYDQEGRITDWTALPVRFVGDDKEDLIGSLEMALRDAKERPVIEVDERVTP